MENYIYYFLVDSLFILQLLVSFSHIPTIVLMPRFDVGPFSFSKILSLN